MCRMLVEMWLLQVYFLFVVWYWNRAALVNSCQHFRVMFDNLYCTSNIYLGLLTHSLTYTSWIKIKTQLLVLHSPESVAHAAADMLYHINFIRKISFLAVITGYKVLCAVSAWFWYTAFFYRYSSAITAPFPSPFVATVYRPSLLHLGFLTLPLFLPLHFPPSLLRPPHLFPSPHKYNMPIQVLYRPVLHY